MRIFTRLFLSSLTTALVAAFVIIAIAPLVFERLYGSQIEVVSPELEPTSASVERTIRNDVRRATTVAELLSLPIATLVALSVAHVQTKPISGAIRTVEEGSQNIACGHYDKSIDLPGNGELASLATSLNQMASALSQAERDQMELIGTVAHELRTPLTTLQGYAEAFNDGVMQPERAARVIEQELVVMRRIINDLLHVARIEAGTVELRRSKVDLSELVFDMHERFAGAFENRGIQFRIDLPSPLPPA